MQGNKWYKLQPFLEEVARRNLEGYASLGGPFSNHLIALAYAAFEQKKKAVFLIRGGREEWIQNPAIQQMSDWGVQLIPINRTDYRLLHSGEIDWKSFVSGSSSYCFVPLGGSSPNSILSVAGWAEAISKAIEIETVVLPVASAGTISGFAVGLASNKNILGIEVLKSNGGMSIESDRLISESGQVHSSRTIWNADYHFGGYARHTEELKSFCRQVSKDEIFPIEPIYSGKAFFAVSDLARKGYFHEGSRILLVHTGGIFPWNSALNG